MTLGLASTDGGSADVSRSGESIVVTRRNDLPEGLFCIASSASRLVRKDTSQALRPRRRRCGKRCAGRMVGVMISLALPCHLCSTF